MESGGQTAPERKGGPSRRAMPAWLSGLIVLALVYLFLVGIKMMGVAFELFGAGLSASLIRITSNPVVGLFVGVLTTALVRSSSLTTSVVVGMVAGGELTLANAVPIIMGANIGTSLTNVLVSLIYVRRKDEFRRAFAGAIVHDLFNWCTVLLLFPIEWITRVNSANNVGYLQRVSLWLTDLFIGTKGVGAFEPLSHIIDPVVKLMERFLQSTIGMPPRAAAWTLTIASVGLLVAVLWGITEVLRRLVAGKVEVFLDRYLFRNAFMSFMLGLVLTSIVQSSSVTTSLLVPLLGAGLLTIEQAYPYTLGANIGTTMTAFLASLAVMTQSPLGFTCAMVHFLFNVHGSIVFYPLRVIPITAAKWYAALAAEKPRYALFFIVGVFFVLPGVVIGTMRLFGWG